MEVTEIKIPEKKVVENKFVEHGQLAVSGGLHLPNYGSDESDTVRGDEALRAIKKVLESGYGVVTTVTEKTNGLFREKLEELKKMGKLTTQEEGSLPDEDAHSYGESRRQAVEQARREGYHYHYTLSCELEKEKLLQPENLEKLSRPFVERPEVGMVVMNRRGMMEKLRGIENNVSGLPEAQYFGEYSQNLYIWRNWKEAGFEVPEIPLDLLNGTRMFNNEPITFKTEGKKLTISPADIVSLRYKYDNEKEIGFPYKLDHYSAAIYFSPTILIALAGKESVASVEIDYEHPEEQTKVEEAQENREMFEKKRQDQKRAIVLQNFDLCANIVKWKEEGKWPDVIANAVATKEPIHLDHYDIREWKLEDGKLVKR